MTKGQRVKITGERVGSVEGIVEDMLTPDKLPALKGAPFAANEIAWALKASGIGRVMFVSWKSQRGKKLICALMDYGEGWTDLQGQRVRVDPLA